MLHEIRGLPHVVDAIVKGRDIRVLLSRHADTAYFTECCRKLRAGALQVEDVDPAFEDAFIDLLKTQDEVAEPGMPPAETVLAPSPKLIDRSNKGAAVIEVAGLMRKFGDFTAVGGIDFSVKRGEIFGLLGPNGAGKSTTFKMLCGLLPPTDGKALVLGIDLRRAAAVARSRIGYMAQKFSLYGNMSVLQNLQFFASAYGLNGQTRRRKIDEELAEFGLVPYADMISETLPLGYKQRLALVCAIMHAPGVLFLDEPTSGVDPLVRREFWTRINAMAAAGVTVMVTTHFMEEAEYCDRIGIIYRGQLVALGTPENLKSERRNTDLPQPTLEDAFIDLIEHYDQEHPQ
jgi:drug efflux transport system ATP-binding protein